MTTVVAPTNGSVIENDDENANRHGFLEAAAFGIAVDNIRESAEVGRTALLASKLSDLSDSLNHKEVSSRFSAIENSQKDSEYRVLDAIRNVKDDLKQQKIETLERQLLNSQEARRDEKFMGVLEKILSKLP